MSAVILEEAGKPMHVAQIVEQMKRKFRVAPKPNTLGVTLYRYAQRGKRFYKVQGKPNTYGLIKWQSLGERADAAKPEKSLK
jgi:hypothetical protein